MILNEMQYDLNIHILFSEQTVETPESIKPFPLEISLPSLSFPKMLEEKKDHFILEDKTSLKFS